MERDSHLSAPVKDGMFGNPDQEVVAMRSQVSDSIPCGILLALSGGCMDAYSYLFRGQVFANAQTGNMLLCGVNVAAGNPPDALKYLLPVLAFTTGIVLSDFINQRIRNLNIHWRQISVLIETLLLILVAFLPETADTAANAITSFACGIQVESFRKIHGNSIATTMCIGNLRNGTYNIDKFMNTHDRAYLKKAALYYGIILSFVIGAVIESRMIPSMQSFAILFSPLLLTMVLLIMFHSDSGSGETGPIAG